MHPGILFRFILILSVVSTAHAQVPNHTLTIPRISTVRIDGDLTDIGWTEASEKGAKIVSDLSGDGRRRSPYPRVAYVGYDSTAFYVGGVVYSPDAAKLRGGSGRSLYQGDCIELIFQTDPARRQDFVYLGVSVSGDVCVIPFAAAGTPPAYDESLVKAKASRDDIRALIEVAIPWTFLQVAPPRAGDTWKFNLGGHHAADLNQYTYWNPIYGGFQDPNRFATITFGK